MWLRNRQQHLDIADGIKVFRDFANAFLHVLTQGRSDLDILASYSECCHKTHPLSYFYAAKRHNLLKKAMRRTLLDVTVSYPIREIERFLFILIVFAKAARIPSSKSGKYNYFLANLQPGQKEKPSPVSGTRLFSFVLMPS